MAATIKLNFESNLSEVDQARQRLAAAFRKDFEDLKKQLQDALKGGVDGGDSAKTISELNKALAEAETRLKALETVSKSRPFKKSGEDAKGAEGSIATLNKRYKEAKTALEQLDRTDPDFDKQSAEVRELNKELSEFRKSISGANRTAGAAEDSINGLRQRVKDLNKELDNTSRSNPNFDRLTKESAAATAELKALEAQTGRNQRNVGNYADALDGLGGSLTDVTSLLGGLGLDNIAGQFEALAAGVLSVPALIGGVGLAAGVLAVDAVKAYEEVDAATDQLQRTLGTTRESAEALTDVAQDAFADNFFEDVGDASEAVAFLKRSIDSVTDEALPDLLVRTEAVASTFEKDFNEIASSAQSLVDNFDNLTYPQALDLITAGFQGGLDRSGDLLDSLEEYAPQFATTGATAQEFFSLLDTGLAGGVLGTDKAADAFKELLLRIEAGSPALRDELAKIGVDYNKLADDIDSGAISQSQAFQLVIDALGDVDERIADSVVRSGELGTQFEDLGTDAVLGLSLASDAFDDVSDAAQGVADGFDDIGSQSEEVRRKFQLLKQDAGEVLAPLAGRSLDVILVGLNKLLESADELSGGSKELKQEAQAAREEFVKIAEASDAFAALEQDVFSFDNTAANLAERAREVGVAIRQAFDIEDEAQAFAIASQLIQDGFSGSEDALISLVAAQIEAESVAASADANLLKRTTLYTESRAVIDASTEASVAAAEQAKTEAAALELKTAIQTALNEAVADGTITQQQASATLAAGVPTVEAANAAVEKYAESNRILKEQFDAFLGSVTNAPEFINAYAAAITLANSDSTALIETTNGEITAQENLRLKLSELQEAYRLTAFEKSLAKAETLAEIEVALQLGVQTGILTAELAEQRLEYARDAEAIDTVTTRLQSQRISVDEAALAIDILAQTQGINGEAALAMAGKLAIAEGNTGSLSGATDSLQGRLNTLAGQNYDIEYADNAGEAIGNADAVKSRADAAAGTRSIHYNITTSGAPPAGGSSTGGPVISANRGANFRAGTPILVGDAPGGRLTKYSELVVPTSSGQVVSGNMLQTAINVIRSGDIPSLTQFVTANIRPATAPLAAAASTTPSLPSPSLSSSIANAVANIPPMVLPSPVRAPAAVAGGAEQRPVDRSLHITVHGEQGERHIRSVIDAYERDDHFNFDGGTLA